MGRSVAYASNASCVVYLNPDLGEEDDAWAWDDFVEDVRNVVAERFKSFVDEDHWLEREVRAILYNDHAYVAIAEYCGMVSISLVPRSNSWGDVSPLAKAWCEQIADTFKQHLHKRFPQSALVKLGTFSNGESVYRRVGGEA